MPQKQPFRGVAVASPANPLGRRREHKPSFTRPTEPITAAVSDVHIEAQQREQDDADQGYLVDQAGFHTADCTLECE